DGSSLKSTTPITGDVIVIGPSYDLGVSEISIEPNQQDELTIYPGGEELSYKTATGEAPDLILGFTTKDADYAFTVSGYDMEPGDSVNLYLDRKSDSLVVHTLGNQKPGNYGIYVQRIDDKGSQVFGYDDIPLSPDDALYIDY